MNELTPIGNYNLCKKCGGIAHKGSKFGLCELHEKEWAERLKNMTPVVLNEEQKKAFKAIKDEMKSLYG